MTLTAVATRYAHALGPRDAVSELRAFAAALAASTELQNALATPAVPVARKRAVVGRIAEILQLSRISRNFLYVLIDHRRIAALPGILDSFELIVDDRLGFARAEVAAARDMAEPQRAALASVLERLTGRRIRMRFTVDERLIGGVVARIGSTVYDGSVRGQLASLGRRLGAET
jgi:F-type H+-transporting ATPase subunit delta